VSIEFKHLLVPIDFGEPSLCALDAAMELARRFDGKLTLVHVCDIPSYVYGGMTYATTDLLAPIEEAARDSLDKMVREVERRLPGTTAVLRSGPPALEILAVVDELHPDLVVIGTHGRTGVKHALLGSVAERVVRTTSVPVLTIHARPHG
jgi:nucleotide-binding universal stress UspA family protein